MSESGCPDAVPSPAPGGFTPEARRRQAWQLVGVSASVLVALTAVDMFDDQRAGTFAVGKLGAELAMNAVIMVVVVAGMLGLRKTGVRWLQPSPAMNLSKEQRRAAARAMRPGGEVAPEHRTATVAMARYLRRYRWAPGFFLVVGVVNGWSFVTETGAGRWFYGACALVGFAFTAYYVVTLRRARTIVGTDGEPGSPESAA